MYHAGLRAFVPPCEIYSLPTASQQVIALFIEIFLSNLTLAKKKPNNTNNLHGFRAVFFSEHLLILFEEGSIICFLSRRNLYSSAQKVL